MNQAQKAFLLSMFGKDGTDAETIIGYKGFTAGLKSKLLHDAVTLSQSDYFKILDRVHDPRLVGDALDERLEFIRSVKLINDMCCNSKVLFTYAEPFETSTEKSVLLHYFSALGAVDAVSCKGEVVACVKSIQAQLLHKAGARKLKAETDHFEASLQLDRIAQPEWRNQLNLTPAQIRDVSDVEHLVARMATTNSSSRACATQHALIKAVAEGEVGINQLLKANFMSVVLKWLSVGDLNVKSIALSALDCMAGFDSVTVFNKLQRLQAADVLIGALGSRYPSLQYDALKLIKHWMQQSATYIDAFDAKNVTCTLSRLERSPDRGVRKQARRCTSLVARRAVQRARYRLFSVRIKVAAVKLEARSVGAAVALKKLLR